MESDLVLLALKLVILLGLLGAAMINPVYRDVTGYYSMTDIGILLTTAPLIPPISIIALTVEVPWHSYESLVPYLLQAPCRRWPMGGLKCTTNHDLSSHYLQPNQHKKPHLQLSLSSLIDI
jgi:hypothetical protein